MALDRTDTLSTLLKGLRKIRGSFVVADNGTWSFTGDHALLASFYPFGNEAVASLVECLDDLEATPVMLQNKPVPVGVMCGLALQRMASATDHEDDAGDWPGVVLPTATPEQLRAAKDAWKVVLETRRYQIM
jgi:hypothetical protein